MSEILVDKTLQKDNHLLMLRAQTDKRMHNLLDMEEQLPFFPSLKHLASLTKCRRCATSDLESDREKKQLRNKESSATLDFIENTSVNSKLEEE